MQQLTLNQTIKELKLALYASFMVPKMTLNQTIKELESGNITDKKFRQVGLIHTLKEMNLKITLNSKIYNF